MFIIVQFLITSSTITYILNLNKIGLFQNYLFTSTLQKSQQKYFTALASKVSQIWKKIIILIRDYLILGGKLGKYGWVFRRIEPMNNCFLVFLAFSEDFFQLIPFSTLLVSGGLASLCLCLSLFCPGLFSACNTFWECDLHSSNMTKERKLESLTYHKIH